MILSPLSPCKIFIASSGCDMHQNRAELALQLIDIDG